VSDYYGLDSEPITMDEWVAIMSARHEARKDAPNGESDPSDDPTRIGSTHIGDVWVSTVYLGLDHAMPGQPPLIFETMVFGGVLNDEGQRYPTIDAARAGHDQFVARVREVEGVRA
jgi:hypothetical protein